MTTIKIPAGDVEDVRLFYQEELEKTLKKLQHIKSVLSQLGDVADSDVVTGEKTKITAGKATDAPVKKRKRRKKAGRKSVWEPLIMKRLRQLDKPVTYDELTEEVMVLGRIPAQKKEATKQAIVGVTFRMRTRDKKIDTFSIGKREKYIGLRQWFTEPGVISKEYADKVIVKENKKKGKRKPRKT